jgi:signal transduction histidine kinase
MGSLVEVGAYVNAVAFALLALVAVREWLRRRARAPGAGWAALALGALALVAVGGRILPAEGGAVEAVGERALVAVLVLFPYLLYRFSTAFGTTSRRVYLALGGMTVALILWTFALPDIPAAGEPRPLWFGAYLVAFLVHWAVLSVVVAVRLWRAGRGQPTVARRRMRMLSGAAAALTAAIFLSAVAGDPESPVRLAAQAIAFGTAVAFTLAVAPPWLVRMLWRRREEEPLQRAVADLMRATTEDEVASRVLEPVARVVGARGVALCADDGRLIGLHGLSEDEREALAAGGVDAVGEPTGRRRIDFGTGSLVLWTTPYSPYFGDEEFSMLRALGGLIGVALDRSRLFAHERAAREALEEADRLKSNFVSLAAHELRAPVAAVHGLAETLLKRAPELPEPRRIELREMLVRQTSRLLILVEQLLDLSRLEADAIAIRPEILRVRTRVEEIVAGTAGVAAPLIEVRIPDALEAPVDPAAFDRIVSNLVANALRYGAEPISITAELRDRHFRLAVEDRGPGVPPELIPDLFERFARGASARVGGVGTGLGLAIARSYAQAHAGDLLYEPAEPHGARFELVLPVEAQERRIAPVAG